MCLMESVCTVSGAAQLRQAARGGQMNRNGLVAALTYIEDAE